MKAAPWNRPAAQRSGKRTKTRDASGADQVWISAKDLVGSFARQKNNDAEVASKM